MELEGTTCGLTLFACSLGALAFFGEPFSTVLIATIVTACATSIVHSISRSHA